MPDRKEHGLLLRGAMVRQRLAGAKTSTMRPMGRHNTLVGGKMPDPDLWAAIAKHRSCASRLDPATGRTLYERRDTRRRSGWTVIEPRIQPGHGIWFRETWGQTVRCGYGMVHCASQPDESEPYRLVYRASEPDPHTDYALGRCNDGGCGEDAIPWKWRPSLIMPRWACRLTATVLDVYPRRPCDLTPEELVSEGFPLPADDPDHPGTTFAEFWEALHPGEPMDQWCWFYRLSKHEETDR